MSTIRHSYQPEELTPEISSNPILEDLRKEDWYIVIEEEEEKELHSTVINDLRRGFTLGNQPNPYNTHTSDQEILEDLTTYLSKASNPLSAIAATTENTAKLISAEKKHQQQEAEKDLMTNVQAVVQKVCKYYNQSLQSFPLTLLTSMTQQNSENAFINFSALTREAKLIADSPEESLESKSNRLPATNNKIMTQIIYHGLKYHAQTDAVDLPNVFIYIPGDIHFSTELDPARGFRFQKLGYSNSILKKWSFESVDLKNKENLRRDLINAYQDEFASFKDKLQSAGDKGIQLIELLNSLENDIKNGKVDIMNFEPAQSLFNFVKMSIENCLKPDQLDNEQYRSSYAELASQFSYYYPQAQYFSEGLIALKNQRDFAIKSFEKASQQLDQNASLNPQAVNKFLLMLKKNEATNHQEEILLNQIMWQTIHLIKDDYGYDLINSCRAFIDKLQQHPQEYMRSIAVEMEALVQKKIKDAYHQKIEEALQECKEDNFIVILKSLQHDIQNNSVNVINHRVAELVNDLLSNIRNRKSKLGDARIRVDLDCYFLLDDILQLSLSASNLQAILEDGLQYQVMLSAFKNAFDRLPENNLKKTVGLYLINELSKFNDIGIDSFALIQNLLRLSKHILNDESLASYSNMLSIYCNIITSARVSQKSREKLILSRFQELISDHSIDILDENVSKRLIPFLGMTIQKINQRQLKKDQSWHDFYTELASDLIWYFPVIQKFCCEFISLEAQYNQALGKLENTLKSLEDADSRKNYGLDLLKKIKEYSLKEKSKDKLLLTQVLLQTNRLIKDPANLDHQKAYMQLCQEVQQRQWLRIIGKAMLALVVAAAITALAFFTFGAAIGIPVLALALTGIAPSAAVGVIAGASIFSSEKSKSDAKRALAKDMVAFKELKPPSNSH